MPVCCDSISAETDPLFCKSHCMHKKNFSRLLVCCQALRAESPAAICQSNRTRVKSTSQGCQCPMRPSLHSPLQPAVNSFHARQDQTSNTGPVCAQIPHCHTGPNVLRDSKMPAVTMILKGSHRIAATRRVRRRREVVCKQNLRTGTGAQMSETVEKYLP